MPLEYMNEEARRRARGVPAEETQALPGCTADDILLMLAEAMRKPAPPEGPLTGRLGHRGIVGPCGPPESIASTEDLDTDNYCDGSCYRFRAAQPDCAHQNTLNFSCRTLRRFKRLYAQAVTTARKIFSCPDPAYLFDEANYQHVFGETMHSDQPAKPETDAELRQFIAQNGNKFPGGRSILIKQGPKGIRLCVGMFDEGPSDVAIWVEHPAFDGGLGQPHRHLLQRNPSLQMITTLLQVFAPAPAETCDECDNPAVNVVRDAANNRHLFCVEHWKQHLAFLG